MLASHNSYHLQPQQRLLDALRAALGDAVNGWEYGHTARWPTSSTPASARSSSTCSSTTRRAGVTPPRSWCRSPASTRPTRRCRSPGSRCSTSRRSTSAPRARPSSSASRRWKAWSDAHPGHLPITIQVEPKDDPHPRPRPGLRRPAALDDRRVRGPRGRDLLSVPGRPDHHAGPGEGRLRHAARGRRGGPVADARPGPGPGLRPRRRGRGARPVPPAASRPRRPADLRERPPRPTPPTPGTWWSTTRRATPTASASW